MELAKLSEVIEKITGLSLREPIYSSIPNEEIDEAHFDTAGILKSRAVGFDIHCLHCGMVTPFKSMRNGEHANNYLRARNTGVLKDEIFTLHMHCQRIVAHTYTYIFQVQGTEIVKVGQIPSLEDIDSKDIKKFRPVLDQIDFSELHRAGGLASHGIGIAAFVYLRRIFERLVKRHYDEHYRCNGEIEGWETMRIDEKIKDISDTLPSVLVENRKVYSILSAGIHELDEETCRKHFPIVRAGIISILEEDLQAKEKARAADELRNAIADIAGTVSTKRDSAAKAAID